jgi:general transcription factor 3C polypeptide 5 (transcription factor C subunit 1)
LPINAGEPIDEDERYEDKIALITKQKPPTTELIRKMVDTMKKLFNERPIWTRRALGNQFPGNIDRRDWLFNESIKHVAYSITSGAFRDTLCKYGIDPRSRKRYREYQTIAFMLGEEKKLREEFGGEDEDFQSHIFNGLTLNMKASTWQIADITDPMLVKLVRNAPYRDDFDPVSGYFHNGTWAKLRAIMRVKVEALATNTICLDQWFTHSTLKEKDDLDLNSKWRNGQRMVIPDIFKIQEERNERLRKGEGYVDIGDKIPTTTLERLKRNAAWAAAERRAKVWEEAEAAKAPKAEANEEASETTNTGGVEEITEAESGQSGVVAAAQPDRDHDGAMDDGNRSDIYNASPQRDGEPRHLTSRLQSNEEDEENGRGDTADEVDFASTVQSVSKPTSVPK